MTPLDIAWHAADHCGDRRAWHRSAMLLGLPFLLGACAKLLDVTTPDVTPLNRYTNPAGALLLRANAISLFATIYPTHVYATGVIADEFVTNAAPDDARRPPSLTSNLYPYGNLASARINALIAIRFLEKYAPTDTSIIAEQFANVGFVETFFAEAMCVGVPLGTVDASGVPAAGPVYDRGAMLRDALANFDSARRYAAGSDSISTYAAIGRGRALLDSGNAAAAATAVASVPVSYRYLAYYDNAVGQTNNLFDDLQPNQTFASVANRKGVNGLPFVDAQDPRVPTTVVGTSPSGYVVVGIVFYGSENAPIPVASGVEAALIRAEALLRLGQASAWADSLNALRADSAETGVGSLNPLLADSTTGLSGAGQIATMFRERAFWLYATGHRQGDLRRLVRQYGLTVNSVFPSGPYPGPFAYTGTYGDAVAFSPGGHAEEQNPSFKGCDVTQP